VATEAEIAWAAGLFEGVRRFDAIVDRGRVYGPYLPPSAGDRRKPFWRWAAYGDAAEDVVLLLGSWLSPRRREQARRCGVLLAEIDMSFPRKNAQGLS
jgi:hypothetical protein